MRLVRIICPVGFALVAGCGHLPGRDVKPLVARPKVDGEMIDVSSMAATVRGADSGRPPCPVHPHVAGTMVVKGVSGAVQYRWERSDGTKGSLNQLEAPNAPGKTTALELAPDDWVDSQSGVQLNISEHVHVTYPFDFHAAPVTLAAKCY